MKILTEQLLSVIRESANRMAKTKKEEKTFDFYAEVKPYVDEISALLDEWEVLAKKWISTCRPKYLYPQQIETAKDHIENIAIQSFFHDTSQTRFNNRKQSAEYTLKHLLSEVQNKVAEKKEKAEK
mgnify:CR=1 FL=1